MVPKKKAGGATNKPAAVADSQNSMSEQERALQERLTRAREIVQGFGLDARQSLFVVEYAKDGNGKQAAIRAGYSPRSAEVTACRLLRDDKVKLAVDAVMNDRIEQGIFDGDMVIARWIEIVKGDPNSLTQYRRVCCRYCWGEGNRYQFTPAEMEKEKSKLDEKNVDRRRNGLPDLEWDDQGGTGFNGTRDPNPECPECWGEGVGRPFFTDTRKLAPENRALYAGVKQTKEGLEIQMHSQSDALDKLARHFGLYRDKLAEAVGGTYTKEQLEETFAGVMAQAKARQAQVDAERGAGDNG